jgi:hypothetical protein
MSPWMRKVFIEVLPYYLLMRRPPQKAKKTRIGGEQRTKGSTTSLMVNKRGNKLRMAQFQMQLMPSAVLRKRKERESLGSRSALQRQSFLDQVRKCRGITNNKLNIQDGFPSFAQFTSRNSKDSRPWKG